MKRMKRTEAWTVATVLALGVLPWVLTPPPAGAAATDGRSIAEAEVALARGLAAYHRGEMEGARELFEQAARADPDNARARRWLEHVEAGETAPSTPGAAAAPGLTATPSWEIFLEGFAGSDSNPTHLGEELHGVPFEGGPADAVPGDTSDDVLQLGLRAAAHPFARRGGWSLGLVGDGHQALYDELDFLDLSRLRGAVHLAWGGDPSGFLDGSLGWVRVPYDDRPLTVLFQAGVVEDRLDGESWRSEVAGSAALTWRPGRSLATRVLLAARDEDFEQGFEDLRGFGELSLIPEDRTEVALELDQRFFLGARDRYLELGAGVAERSADRREDASLTRARAELSLPFGRSFQLWLSGAWEETDFDDLESNPLFPFFVADRPREDEAVRLAAVASWSLTPRLLLIGRAFHLDRDSELGPAVEPFLDLDFERTGVGLGLRWFFLGGGR